MRIEAAEQLAKINKQRKRMEFEWELKERIILAIPNDWPWPSYVHGSGCYSEGSICYDTYKPGDIWTIERAFELFNRTSWFPIVKASKGHTTTFGPSSEIDGSFTEFADIDSPILQVEALSESKMPPCPAVVKVKWWGLLDDLIMEFQVRLNDTRGFAWADPSPTPHMRPKKVRPNFRLCVPAEFKDYQKTVYAGVNNIVGVHVLWRSA